MKLPWPRQPLQRAWKISQARSQQRSLQRRLSRPGFWKCQGSQCSHNGTLLVMDGHGGLIDIERTML